MSVTITELIQLYYQSPVSEHEWYLLDLHKRYSLAMASSLAACFSEMSFGSLATNHSRHLVSPPHALVTCMNMMRKYDLGRELARC